MSTKIKILAVILVIAIAQLACLGSSKPPHTGAFLKQGRNYIEMQEFRGGPDTLDAEGIPASKDEQPLIILWFPDVQPQFLRLSDEIRSENIDFDIKPDGDILEIRPEDPLDDGVYCLSQGDPMLPGALIPYWCFSVGKVASAYEEIDNRKATEQAAMLQATRVWEELPNKISAKVVGAPRLGDHVDPYGEKIRLVEVDVKVTNQDSQPHFVCFRANTLVNLPERILADTWGSENPIQWWGISWDYEVNECYIEVGAQSSATIPISLGDPGSGHNASEPSSASLMNLSEADFIQWCIDVSEIDGRRADVHWQENQSLGCER